MRAPRQVGGYNFHPQFGSDRDAMIRTMIAEGRNQGDAGLRAIGYNLRNRMDAGYHGAKSIQDVVLQPYQYSSFNANDPKNNSNGRFAMGVKESDPIYQRAAAAADEVLGRMVQDPTHGASHYFAKNGMKGGHAPGWASKMINLGNEGAHTFMREKNFNVATDANPGAAGDQIMVASRDPGGMPQLTDLPQYADKAPPIQVASLETQMGRGDAPLPPMRPSEPLSSAEYLTHNFGGDHTQRALPSVQETAPPPPMMTDSTMPATGGVEGMASMMAPPTPGGSGMGAMMANAFVPPQAPMMMEGADMGGAFSGGGLGGGGGDFGGGFNLGGIFG